MTPAKPAGRDVERVLEQIERLLGLLEQAGSQIPEEHLRRSRERLQRLRDGVAAGANQIEAISKALVELQESVEELKTGKGREHDDPER